MTKTQTINGVAITIEHVANGTSASAMVKDSAGEYLHTKLYQGYSDTTVFEVFAQEIDYLGSY